MNTLIHILIIATMLGLGVCLVVMVKIINDMNVLINRMKHRLDNLADCQNIVNDMAKDIREAEQSRQAIKEEFARKLVEQFKERFNINVVDKEKPLEFPNDRS